MYVSKYWAGSANHPAIAGASIPARPAAKLSSIASGTNGTISKFAGSATNDNCRNVCSTYGTVSASAHKLSTKIARIMPGSRPGKNRLAISGASSSTPANAKNDKYQLTFPHKYKGFAKAVIAAANSNSTSGRTS